MDSGVRSGRMVGTEPSSNSLPQVSNVVKDGVYSISVSGLETNVGMYTSYLGTWILRAN